MIPVDMSEISTISSPSKWTAKLDALKPPCREKLPASETQLESDISGYRSPCADCAPALSIDALRLYINHINESAQKQYKVSSTLPSWQPTTTHNSKACLLQNAQ